MPGQRKILVVEDNVDLSRLIELHLTDQGWNAVLEFDGKKGFEKAVSGQFDLMILDIMLPSLDGLEILKQLRSAGHLLPVIMLTSKSSEVDRITGLESGADDYITKPFSIRELMARVRAVFRRTESKGMDEAGKAPVLTKGELTIHPEKRTVTVKGNKVELTAKEFDLLYFFARHPGRVFNRSQLLDKVWGYGHDGYEHTVNSNINRLRAKIETTPSKPEYILTVWGVGYKFRED